MNLSRTILDAGVAGLPSLYRSGATTPVEACRAYIDRIDRFDGALRAWTAIDAKGALAAARASAARWADGAPLSPLDGCPVGIKANIAVNGLPWHAGIGAYRDRLAAADADCVVRLRDGGAVILGLLNMDEGAFGATTDNPWFGRTQNPWRRGHMAGGSSGGSAAAVCAGLCAAALGTDTLGSVRIPAALCGVYGHKPGRAAISVQGVTALSPTLDHVEVLARSADDCAALLAVLAVEDCTPTGLPALARRPIAAMSLGPGDGADAAVFEAFEHAVAAAGAAGLKVERIDLGILDVAAMRAAVLVIATEGAAEHAPGIEADAAGFSPLFLQRLDLGRDSSAAAVAAAHRTLGERAARARAALADYGALLTPAAPRAAPGFDDDMRDGGLFTALGNVLGWPATAFPSGLSADGLPLSVQAMAARGANTLGLARLLGQPIGFPGRYG